MRTTSLLSMLIFMFSGTALMALSVTGKIINNNGEAMPSLIVILSNTDDTTQAKFCTTSPSGEFLIKDLQPGNYSLTVTTGITMKFESDNFKLTNDSNFREIKIVEAVHNLNEVAVKATKPIIETKAGKTILHVDALASTAGKTAYDLLQQSPNVSVNQNAINMRGKQGVLIMIDGKPSPLTGENLMTYLKALPANAVERVEIITNASAKYDAAGNAGIINIVLRKDTRLGTNGNISISAGHGRYHKSNNGFSLNNRNAKTNIFASYNYNNRKGFNDLSLYRKFYNNDSLLGAYNQFNGLNFPVQSQSFRTGIDYYANPKTILGITLNGALTSLAPMGSNTTKVMDANEQFISRFATTNNSTEKWWNYAANFNFKHTFDSTGKEMTADLDFASYANVSDQNFTTGYWDKNGNPLQKNYLLHGDVNGSLMIRSLKVDYTHPFTKDEKLETGIKSSDVTADNNLVFADVSDGTAVFDSTKSNHFIYGENINAAYVNYSKSKELYNLQLGLRFEQTNVKGKQLIDGKTFDNSYAQLFPNIAIDKNFTKNYNAGISLSRRIDRPSYEQLNPFKFFLDPTTYKEGNPYLKPQLSLNAEFTQTIKQKTTITLGYSITNRLITEVLVPAAYSSNITVQTNVNLTRFDYYGLSIATQYKPLKWWNSMNNINVYYGYYRGNLANTPLSNGSAAFDLNSNNTFILKNNWNAELSLFYNSGQVYAYMTNKSFWQLNTAIQKTFDNRRGSVKLAINDIFWTAISAGESTFKNYNETYYVQRDTRAAFVAVNYKVGKTTVSPSRRRNGGAEDEKRRASKGGA